MASGTRFVDKQKTVPALVGTVPSSSTPKWVSLKGYNHIQVGIYVLNGASGVTGSAIALQQAKAVAGTNAKALAFTKMWASTDVANSVALTQTTVSSNTFTTANTGSAVLAYYIEVDADDLDMANGFDCFQVTTGNAVNATVTAIYTMGNVPRYAGGFNSLMNPLVD